MTVGKNDTVAKLADKHGSYTQAVLAANLLSEDSVLQAGTEIFLPGAKAAAVTASAPKVRSRANVSAKVVHSYSSSRMFRWPVMGKISSVFGWRRSRSTQEGLPRWIRAPGDGIVAAGDGKWCTRQMGGYERR